MTPLAELRGVSKRYGRAEAATQALRGVDLRVHCGEVILIVGPSGSGKTTLLQTIGLLLPSDTGEVLIRNRRIGWADPAALVRCRRDEVSFIFQEFNLLEALSVHDNVALVSRLHEPDARRRSTRTESALRRVGLSDVARRDPRTLSGGQKQRVAIARALASPARLILADEPTGNLDWHSAEPIVRQLASLANEDGRCVIMVSHDVRLEPYAHRIIHLVEGTIIDDHATTTSSGGRPQHNGGDLPQAGATAIERSPGGMRWWWAVLAVLVVLAVSAHQLRDVLVGPPSAPAAPPLHTVEAPLGNGAVVAAAPAVVEPVTKAVALRSERPGRIKAILKQAGERVKANEPVVRLDDEPARALVAETEALVEERRKALDVARAQLKELNADYRPERIAAAEARVQRTVAELDRAQRERKRRERMSQTDAVSEDELANATEEVRIVEAAQAEARHLLSLLEAGPTEEEVAVADARIAQAAEALEQATRVLDRAKIELDRHVIRSPFDGVVLYRHLEPGEVVGGVSAGAMGVNATGVVVNDTLRPILTVGNIDRLQLRAEVDEADIGRVRVGQPVIATAEAFGDRTFAGTVTRLEPVMGRKNIRTERPTERLDTKVREVVIALNPSGESATAALPVDLQMTVRFLADGAASRPAKP